MQLKLYSRESGQLEPIRLEISRDGWLMFHECYHGPCDRQGKPHLLDCIKHYFADYPPAFGDALEELWESAWTGVMGEAQIQQCLDQFSSWINSFDQTRSPRIDWNLSAFT